MRRLCLIALGLGFGLGLPRAALAHPGVEGTRNLSLGSVGRSSASGTNAALINPSSMPFTQTFAIEPIYQLGVQGRRHGLGFVLMDSLNNPRLSVGLGYLVMRGSPTVSFAPASDGPTRLPDAGADPTRSQELELVHVAHETFASVGVTVVKQWLAFGLRPKYQFSSLRYRDASGAARNANERLSTFGLDASVTINFAGWAAVSGVVNNIVGNHSPPFTDDRELNLTDAGAEAGTIDSGTVDELSDFPFTVAHGLSVFPLHNPNFSVNFDGMYDFSSYRFENYTRRALGGSAEFVVGPVPLRLGTLWDSRGQDKDDDRMYVAGGLAYVKQAKDGGVGVDIGMGVRQQVSGPGLGGQRETVLSFNLGLRIRPNI